MKRNILLGTVGLGIVALALTMATGGCGGGHSDDVALTSSSTGILLLTAETPPTGPITGGTQITLTGTGFATGISVLVANLPATNVNVLSETSLTAVTPAGFQGAADITVFYPTTGQGFVLPAGFTYLTLPQIYSINPTTVPDVATALNLPFVLTGAGFEPGLTTVSFGTNVATGVIVQSPNFLTGTIPAMVTTATVVVSIDVAGTANVVPANTPPTTFIYGSP
jgi:hypothetical protein